MENLTSLRSECQFLAVSDFLLTIRTDIPCITRDDGRNCRQENGSKNQFCGVAVEAGVSVDFTGKVDLAALGSLPIDSSTWRAR